MRLERRAAAGDRSAAVRLFEYYSIARRDAVQTERWRKRMQELEQSVDRMSRQPSNHAMERTATRRALTFSLTSVPSFRATLALGGRRSSYSR
jgi:hypothetical protein